MDTIIENKNKLSNLQLELLKSLKYIASEKQITEVKSLLRFYFTQRLDAAIEKEEIQRKYTEDIYENWLKSSNKPNDNFQ